MGRIDELYQRFPAWLRQYVIDHPSAHNFTEIRLKTGRGVLCYTAGKCFRLDELSGSRAPSEKQLREMLVALSGYSLNIRMPELNNGFLTLEGGHRVGVCSAVAPSGLHSFSSMSIRVAREIRNCSAQLYGRLDERRSILIAGQVSSGKTTLLRDMVRHLASEPEYLRVAVVDERRELAAVCRGIPQFDMGDGSDILDGVAKSAGCEMAVRSLSPDYIVCDEIGNQNDLRALEYAKSCGCRILASIHTESRPEEHVTKLFDSVAYLGSRDKTGRILNILDKEI